MDKIDVIRKYQNTLIELIKKGDLHPEIGDLIKLIEDIQSSCDHVFQNGKCIYCDMNELKDE
jgi:hypothetical protein